MKLNFFNFKRFEDKILITNDFGEFVFLNDDEFKLLLNKKIDLSTALGRELIEKHFVYQSTELDFSNKNKYFMREKKGYLNYATSLHIFVVTTACNFKCIYCQANNGNSQPMYMNDIMSERAVDIALQSPAKFLTFEFQGGEPLLNFESIKHIVLYSEKNKGKHKIEYSIVTNLTLINDEIIDFIKEYKIGISTSIDGNKILHNKNRPYKNGMETFNDVVNSVNLLRKNGINAGAIQTTTRYSLEYPIEIVNTYKNLGFNNIFIRPLTPLGKALNNWNHIGYSPEEFIAFYKIAFEEIIKINKNGIFLKDSHASILLDKINGKSVNYMDLRSPCGAGIGQMAYYPDGNAFTCDEARMLHEMGDNAFYLGNVFKNTYNEMINNSICKSVCSSSIIETIPSCCDCVYQPFCGSCPVVNYAQTNDIIEKSPNNYRCKIYKGILDLLFSKIKENDVEIINVFKSWSC